ncbi:hypothetical protein ABBQ32_007453 [Trebouxia sp. C0010 RCD-2024]
MDQHVRQLKQQHAAHVNELQLSLNRQSIEIDDLSAQLQAVQADSRCARRSAEAAAQQVSATEKKLAGAKADLHTANIECAELQARQQDAVSKASVLSAAAKLTADWEVNLQQQISALRHKLASSSNQQDILEWQNRVEQAHQEIAALQQDKKQADAKVMQFEHLRDELSAQQQELSRRRLHTQEAHRALSHSQGQLEQLQNQLETLSSTDRQKQSQLAVLTDRMSQQQKEVALAKEQTSEACKRLEDCQQAATSLEQQLHSIKGHVVAQNASRQHVQDQLDNTQVQVQEQAATLHEMVEKLDIANSSMLAKDRDIQLLKEQVQQMPALVAQTQVAKQNAQDIQVQLDAAAEQLQMKDQEIMSLRGEVEALQRQQAQVNMVEAALACSKSEAQKIQTKNADMEKLLASKQDELHTEQAKQQQQESDSASMHTAMKTLQRQLEDASTVQQASLQQLAAAQMDMNEYRQQIADLRDLLASSNASLHSSSQSITALQESVSLQTNALTASEAKCQTLLLELDSKDGQLKQAMAKLHAVEYAAAAAQDAATRLQAKLAGQQTEAGDQSRELSEALEVGSVTVHQLELTIQALQEKVFAAEHAMESQQEQLSNQQAAASNADQQVKQLVQHLASKHSLVTSLQTALTTAHFVAESNQQLVSSLQLSLNTNQMDASEQVQHLTEQLQQQDKLVDVQQEQTALAGRVAFLTKLLERREQREWQIKIPGTEFEMGKATGVPEQSASSSQLGQHVTPAGNQEQVAVLKLAPQANGASLEATIKATANFDAVGTPLSNATNTAQGPAGKLDAMDNGGDLEIAPTQTVKGIEVKQVLSSF